MEQNKLKLEDCCLTLEQAKEINKLGINTENSIYLYGEDRMGDSEPLTLVMRSDVINSLDIIKTKFDITNTLTNTEMLEMLPINITLKGDILSFMIGRDVSNNYYNVVYQCIYANSCCISFNNKLLRDSLFEMIRYLKTNKLM